MSQAAGPGLLFFRKKNFVFKFPFLNFAYFFSEKKAGRTQTPETQPHKSKSPKPRNPETRNLKPMYAEETEERTEEATEERAENHAGEALDQTSLLEARLNLTTCGRSAIRHLASSLPVRHCLLLCEMPPRATFWFTTSISPCAN